MNIFGHLAFVLIVFSFLVKDILWLRVISIIASIAGIVYNYFVPAAPLWLVINWNLVFIAINIVQIGILLREKMSVSSPLPYHTIFRHI